MWSGSRLAVVISLIAAAVLIATIVSVLLLTHVVNKPVTQRRASFSAPTPIGLPINVSLNSPIYVVGPQTLTQSLVNAGVPQSLIKPIGLNQLPSLPNNSIVVVDWSVIKPYVAYDTVGGNITLNLTSPAVGLLEGLFTKGDLVLVNVSKTEAPIAELLLSYTMAKGANIVVYGPNGARFYLVPMLEMPINSKYVLIGATAIRTPHGIAVLIGPVSLEGLPNLFRNWLWLIEVVKGEIKPPTTNQDPSYQNVDPCNAVYWNLGVPQGSNGVYTSGNFIFLWGMNALESQGALGSTYGVQAVEDNYGDMFYYDSCIVMANSLTSTNPAYIDAELLGDVAYKYTYSGEFYPGLGQIYYLIGGFDMYTSHESLGNEVEFNGICYPYTYNAYVADSYGVYEPAPTSSAGSYSIGFSFPPPSISITYTLPSSSLGGVNIDVSTTPCYVNEAGEYAYNLTWTFDYTEVTGTNAMPNYGVLINGFVVGQDGNAVIWLTNYSPGNTYWFYLPFNAEVETICWSAWANMAWVVGLATSSSNAVSISTAYFGYPLTQPPGVPSGSWISGYSIQSPGLTDCGSVSLSGPS
jgi:hypothetical protein